MSYLNKLNESLQNPESVKERTLSFNEKVSERKSTSTEPIIMVNKETGRITLSQSIIDTLELSKNRFNIAVDDNNADFFLYINNDKGWAPGKNSKFFTSGFLARRLADFFQPVNVKFQVRVNLESEKHDDTTIWQVYSLVQEGNIPESKEEAPVYGSFSEDINKECFSDEKINTIEDLKNQDDFLDNE